MIDARALVALLTDLGAKVDVILPDGTHLYWSTHCRHGDDDACAAETLHDDAGNTINRRPAQCKRCRARCVCDCHKELPMPPDPHDRVLSVRLNGADLDALHTHAAARGVSVSDLVRYAIHQIIDNPGSTFSAVGRVRVTSG